MPFFQGPQGLADAINGADDERQPTGVTASGWGAGQTGTALGILAANRRPDDLDNIGLVILDNNTNRAGGGFWTTYRRSRRCCSPQRTRRPTDLETSPVLDVAYEYNINSDAPVDPLNPFALGNSLAAYAFGYGAENRTLRSRRKAGRHGDLPAAERRRTVELQPGHHYVVDRTDVITS